MGNTVTKQILARNMAEDEKILYWPDPPYEGHIKLRFRCSVCSGESILLDPFPITWQEVAALHKSQCFQCKKKTIPKVCMFEWDKDRQLIYEFAKGMDVDRFANIIQKATMFCPSSSTDSEGKRAEYRLVCHPPNFKKEAVPGLVFDLDVVKLPFPIKLGIFHQFIKDIMLQPGLMGMAIDRDDMIHSSYEYISRASIDDLRRQTFIVFKGEQGLDMGGVSREFFTEVVKHFLNPDYGFFTPSGPNKTFHLFQYSSLTQNGGDSDEYCQMQPESEKTGMFSFFGRIVGKALFEGQLIPARFTAALFKLILGRSLDFTDFETVNKDVYNQLIKLRTNTNEELEDLCLTFVAPSGLGQKELLPNGNNVDVNKSNVDEYIRLRSQWSMVGSAEEEIKAFLGGVYDVVPVQLLNLFSPCELEMMLCGAPEIDVENWKKHAHFIHFSASSPTPSWFWSVISEFTPEQRASLLHFVTSTSSVIDFAYMYPPFCVRSCGRSDNLPEAHTCLNLLDLPEYGSKEELRAKLVTAIEMGAVGFSML